MKKIFLPLIFCLTTFGVSAQSQYFIRLKTKNGNKTDTLGMPFNIKIANKVYSSETDVIAIPKKIYLKYSANTYVLRFNKPQDSLHAGKAFIITPFTTPNTLESLCKEVIYINRH